MSASAPPAPEPLTVTPLVEELVLCPDPWDVARKLAHLPHLLFLDSAEQHPERGRYSYVTADPGKRYRVDEDLDEPRGRLITWSSRLQTDQPDPFLEDRLALQQLRVAPIAGLPPFQGGIAGLFGYNLCCAFERVPRTTYDEFLVDDLITAAYDWVVAFDNQHPRAWLISTGVQFNYQEPWASAERAADRLKYVRELISRKGTSLPSRQYSAPLPTNVVSPQYPLPGFPGVTSNFSRDGYLAAVRRAIEYTHAGDCFQVNLSQRLLAPLTEHPLELYGRLRKTNPAPFACYFDAGDFQIVSASPERFLKVSPGGEVVTQPIKGTRPRGRTQEEDAANVRDLVNSPKDRAENVMIVDLLRNDLGRVCEY